MVPHIRRTFTSSAAGSVLKEVVCEKCGTQFYYELARRGVGQGESPYFIGQDSARHDAEEGAVRDLRRRLNRDVELVPCPSCQWVNQKTIRQYCAVRHRAWTQVAIVIVVLGALTELVLCASAQKVLGKPASLLNPEMWMVAAACTLLFVATLRLQRYLRRRMDPNVQHGTKPRLPVGTPPALIKRGSEEGNFIFDIVPNDLSNQQTAPNWATFRANQLMLPAYCCQCLGPPTTKYRLPFALHKQPMKVPLCASCFKRLRRRWWTWNAISPFAALGIAWLLAQLMPGIDESARGLMILLVGGVGSMIGFVVVEIFHLPYRARWVDVQRGILQVSFHNPAYTAMLIRSIGEADGLFRAPAANKPNRSVEL